MTHTQFVNERMRQCTHGSTADPVCRKYVRLCTASGKNEKRRRRKRVSCFVKTYLNQRQKVIIFLLHQRRHNNNSNHNRPKQMKSLLYQQFKRYPIYSINIRSHTLLITLCIFLLLQVKNIQSFSLIMSSSTKAAAAVTKLMSHSSSSAAVVGKLKPATTAFFLCDIQERFRPLIYNSETIVSTSQYLTSVANTLSIPIVATQQYTKVFGPTVADCFVNGQEGIDELLNDDGHKLKIFEKKKFSMMTDDVVDYCNQDFMIGRDNVVLFGIEAHVCVQQTCLDLIEMGKHVHIIVDCVSSQQRYDREIALRRMENAGAFLTTAQSLAFMLMKSKYLTVP